VDDVAQQCENIRGGRQRSNCVDSCESSLTLVRIEYRLTASDVRFYYLLTYSKFFVLTCSENVGCRRRFWRRGAVLWRFGTDVDEWIFGRRRRRTVCPAGQLIQPTLVMSRILAVNNRLKFHLARLDSTRLDTFDVSSPCILAVSS